MESTRVKYGTTERIFSTAFDASGAPITGLTNVLLQIYRKSDGKYLDFNDGSFKSVGWTTRQGVMTELSTSLQPGVYYYDFNTTGYSTPQIEECYLMTSVSATATNDPIYGELKVGGFVDQIGIGGAIMTGGRGGLTKRHIEDLVERIWKYKLGGEDEGMTAEDALQKAAEDIDFDMSGLEAKIDALEIPEFDLSEVLQKISEIEIPTPQDYSSMFKALNTSIQSLTKTITPSTESFNKSIAEFSTKMSVATEEINSSLETVEDIKTGFEKLEGLVEKFSEDLAVQTDMDRRFASMGGKLNDEKMEKLQESVKKLALELVTSKHEILKELNSK